jgi:hypothetical protein
VLVTTTSTQFERAGWKRRSALLRSALPRPLNWSVESVEKGLQPYTNDFIIAVKKSSSYEGRR